MTQAPPQQSAATKEWFHDLPLRIGQVVVESAKDGGFALRHREDAERADLTVYHGAEAAIEIARYDDSGEYRPLKSAPNLPHGWQLIVPDAASLRLALDFIYPGRLAAYMAWRRSHLRTTPLRATLARQTGMYRVAAKISDEQADFLVGNFCRSDGGCLRTIVWKRDAAGITPSSLLPPQKFDPAHDQTGRGEPAVPLLCQEACNLLVGAARKIVKGE